jgi:hypothetical protein
VYLDPLIKDLRALRVGCHVGQLFMGVMAYADDLVLLAPNRAAAKQLKIMFSLDKLAKTIIFESVRQKSTLGSSCNTSGS